MRLVRGILGFKSIAHAVGLQGLTQLALELGLQIDAVKV